MKRLFFSLLILFILTSCSNDDDITIVGKWKLTQVLADPGDGSGTFNHVTIDKTITFYSDETFKVSGNLCFFDPSGSEETDGYYSEEDGKIYPTSCVSFAPIVLNYTIENKEMVIDFQCIEACAEKYIKIE